MQSQFCVQILLKDKTSAMTVAVELPIPQVSQSLAALEVQAHQLCELCLPDINGIGSSSPGGTSFPSKLCLTSLRKQLSLHHASQAQGSDEDKVEHHALRVHAGE